VGAKRGRGADAYKVNGPTAHVDESETPYGPAVTDAELPNDRRHSQFVGAQGTAIAHAKRVSTAAIRANCRFNEHGCGRTKEDTQSVKAKGIWLRAQQPRPSPMLEIHPRRRHGSPSRTAAVSMEKVLKLGTQPRKLVKNGDRRLNTIAMGERVAGPGTDRGQRPIGARAEMGVHQPGLRAGTDKSTATGERGTRPGRQWLLGSGTSRKRPTRAPPMPRNMTSLAQGLEPRPTWTGVVVVQK